MSFNQCSGCQAMVDESKAYCPDCGLPMDEEQKRVGSSEYDSFMKTQQISKTTQFKLSEHFNQSDSSVPPPKDADKPSEFGNQRKSVVLNLQPIAPVADAIPQQSETIPPQWGSASDPVADKNASVDSSSRSNKKVYLIAGGVISLLLFLALIALVIIGFLYWN